VSDVHLMPRVSEQYAQSLGAISIVISDQDALRDGCCAPPRP
jgi:hypothetical protein